MAQKQWPPLVGCAVNAEQTEQTAASTKEVLANANLLLHCLRLLARCVEQATSITKHTITDTGTGTSDMFFNQTHTDRHE